jgi:hypothetical protein
MEVERPLDVTANYEKDMIGRAGERIAELERRVTALQWEARQWREAFQYAADDDYLVVQQGWGGRDTSRWPQWVVDLYKNSALPAAADTPPDPQGSLL